MMGWWRNAHKSQVVLAPTQSHEDKQLREVFDRMSEDHGNLQFEGFEKVLEGLKVDLGHAERERMFQNMASRTPDGTFEMSFDQFKIAVKRQRFLSNIVSNYNIKAEFEIPLETFDVTKSTEENYHVNNTDEFYGDHIPARRNMDYTYHKNYCKERQLWQDAAIQAIVTRTHPQARPWLVYTSGPPGAGKSYALSWMSEHGYFPLENIVRIDPDYFKSLMPEWKLYSAAKQEGKDVDPASLCHKESGYFAEIAQIAAMNNSQNVWVDTTLKEAKWYSTKFDEYHEKYPHYRIAIFTITAPRERVHERIKARAAATGREVPDRVIEEAYNQIEHAVQTLVTKVDLVANIANESNGSAPVLQAVQLVDRFGSWNTILQTFASEEPSESEFPNSLAPIHLVETHLKDSHVLQRPSRDPAKGAMRPLVTVDLTTGFPFLEQFKNRKFEFWCSPVQQITLDDTTRTVVHIPERASYFCFVHPLLKFGEVEALRKELSDLSDPTGRNHLFLDPLVQLLSYGGFAYFDVSEKLLRVNAITTERTTYLLQFIAPQPLGERWDKCLGKRNRWHESTLQFTRRGNSHEFAWVMPGEKLHEKCHQMWQHGAFAYRFQDKPPIYFGIASSRWFTTGNPQG